MKARVALVGVTAIGIALYALLGGGAKSAVVPFEGRNAATVQTDKYAVAVVSEDNGNIDALAMGPSHSLYFYWQIAGTWYGPNQIGAPGTAYSSPATESELTAEVSSNLDAAVEGPNHTLMFFWQIGATWYGPLQIGGPGSTWSKPAVTVDSHSNVNVSAQGPNGSLYHYWATGGAWHGPLEVAGPGTTFSAPSMHVAFDDDCTSGSGPDDSCLAVAALGPANQSIVYWSLNGTWLAPSTSGQQQEYSTPSISQEEVTPNWWTAYQGPGNSLISQVASFHGGSNSYCVVAGAGTTYGAPGDVHHFDEDNTATTSNGDAAFNIAAAGPGGSLYAYWWNFGPSSPSTCPSFFGPLQLSGAGTLHSVPSVNSSGDSTGNSVVNVLAEGPAHSLWAFWSANGAWYGPLQIGGPGTTFDSAN